MLISTWYVCDYHIYIADKHIYGNSKQNHAEKLSDYEDEVCSEQILHLVEQTDDKVVEYEVEQQADDNVKNGILGAK